MIVLNLVIVERIVYEIATLFCVVQLAFESLSVIINALTLLEVGQVSVCR